MLLGSGLPLQAETPGDPPAEIVRNVSSTAGTVTVRFTHYPIRGENFGVLVQVAGGGIVEHEAGPPRTYLGTVDGHPGAIAAGLLRTDGRMFSRISFENGIEWSSSGGPASIRGNANWTPAWPTSELARGAGDEVFVAEVGVDAPYRQYLVAGGGVDETVEMSEFSVLASNLPFLRDAAILHEVGKVVVRTDAASDPYEPAGGDTNPLLTTNRSEWNNVLPVGNTHNLALVARPNANGGLAWVGAINTSNRYSSNGSDSTGDFTVVWRHEAGHNWGAGHYEGGGRPEGPTIMSDNALSRFSSSELVPILRHRDSRRGSLEIRQGFPFPLPPRANQVRVRAIPGEPLRIDVTANDSDTNGDAFSLLSVPTVSQRGGTLAVVDGGSEGRGEVLYTPPPGLLEGEDRFTYRIVDETGMEAVGHVLVRPDFDEPMLAHWALDEGAGTVAFDATARRFHGELAGGAGWVEGRGGRPALNLGGSSGQRVNLPPLGVSTRTMTISGWVRRDGNQPNWAGIAFTRSGRGAGLSVTSSNQLRFHWEAGSNNSYNYNSGLQLPDQTWTFCALVVSPSRATLYMRPEGQEMQSMGVNASFGEFAFQSDFHLGWDPAQSSRRFRGQMQDFRVFQRSLSAGEIALLSDDGGTSHAPRPPVGAILRQSGGLELGWTPPPGAGSFRLYLGRSHAEVRDANPGSPEFVAELAEAGHDVSGLEGGLWFWRVDALLDGVAIQGPVWHFQLEDAIRSVADGPWNEAATWNHGLPAPTSGSQGTGEDFRVAGAVVRSNSPSSNSQALIGRSLRVDADGVLDLARLHDSTLQNVLFNLPPLVLGEGGTLRFRASNGSIASTLTAPLEVAGQASILLQGGNYANRATLAGPLTGEGLLDVFANSTAGATAGDLRQLSLTRADSSYAGDWIIRHVQNGDDFGVLRATARGSLGTGTVTVGDRSRLVNDANGGLDSLRGVRLEGGLSALILNQPWNQSAAFLDLAAGSPEVRLPGAPSTIGRLSGQGGRIGPIDGSATLAVHAEENSRYAGSWEAGVGLIKRGAARLELAAPDGRLPALDLEAGTLALATADEPLSAPALALAGGALEIEWREGARPSLALDGGLSFAGGVLRVVALDPIAAGENLLLLSAASLSGEPLVELVDGEGEPLPFSLERLVNDGVELRIVAGESGEPGDPYLAWIESYGLSGAEALPGADPDRDGVPNRLEFLLGLDPTDPQSRLELSLVETRDGLAVVEIGPVVEVGDFIIERSGTLAGPWTRHEVEVGSAAERLRVELPVEGPRGFFRLRYEVAED